MKNIGQKLAAKRKELKLSYDDVSKLTKLSITHIKAIEQGDLDYFKDDLTYVRFYVRSYCKAMDVPYENFKDDLLDSVDEYSTTMALKVIKDHDVVDQKITERATLINKTKAKPQFTQKDKTSIKLNVKQSSRFRKKKIDIAFLSLIVVAVLIVGIVLYVGVNALVNKMNEKPSKEDTPSEVTPTPEKKDEPKDKEEEQEDTKVSIEKRTDSTYQYRVGGINLNEAIKMEITFNATGNFNLWQKGASGEASVAGAYGTYQEGQTYTIEAPLQANMSYTCNFWNYVGATIKINGKTIELDANVGIKQEGVTLIEFIFEGE